MTELAWVALAWLSYVALYASSPRRCAPGARVPRARRALSIGVAVTALAMSMRGLAESVGWVGAALVAGASWSLAASLVPVLALVAPRAVRASIGLVTWIALGGLVG